MECKKCTSPGNIVLRKKDSYCDSCFLTNTNHKFRACIGKNKILSKNEKVLVCLSGGLGSTVLLDLIHLGMRMDSHKKLRIIPVFLHLIGTEANSLTYAENVMKQCAKYNFDVNLVHIPQYMEENPQLSANTIPSLSSDTEQQFNLLMKGLSNTTSNDLLLKIQRNLFIKCAEKFHCNFIFTGETTSTLAIKLLSNLALGRGSHVEHDVGFCDARNENIKIIRPMKEISLEELNCYFTLKQLYPVDHNQIKLNSLQSVIGAFVTDLKDTFPATISTVCKTADKIGNHDFDTNRKGKCVICESDLEAEDTKLTALEATMFSRSVSNGKPQDFKSMSISSDPNFDKNLIGIDNSLFPHILKELCYGCSRNYSEINEHKLPNHVQKLLLNQ